MTSRGLKVSFTPMTAVLAVMPHWRGRLHWQGCCVVPDMRRNEKGYIRAPQVEGHSTLYAHRQLLEVLWEDRLLGLEIDHICGVRACVRLDHLRILSKSDHRSLSPTSSARTEPFGSSPRYMCCAAWSEGLRRPPATSKGRRSERRRLLRKHLLERFRPDPRGRGPKTKAEYRQLLDDVLHAMDTQGLPLWEGRLFEANVNEVVLQVWRERRRRR